MQDEWEITRKILSLEQLLRTANAHPETKGRIERNMHDMDEEELDWLLWWASENQINLVQEGKANQKQITEFIKQISGL